MILIVTNKQDTHADEVIKSLAIRSVDIFRLNTEDILSKYKIELELEPNGWHGIIIDEQGRALNIDDLRVAWLRKPEFDFNHTSTLHPDIASFVSSETKAFIDTLYSIPTIKWINDPFIARKKKIKFQQLLLAKEYGVGVPRTLITNCPDVAGKFFSDCGEEILLKTIYTGNVTIDGLNRGIPSRRIGKSNFHKFIQNIGISPTQLQEYIPKAFELRVTVIGNRVFSVKIESQLHEETKTDWRLDTKLNPHSCFELPIRIEKFCQKFLAQQKLDFGAMDFIVTPKGDYVFLENNPYGQYLWLEIETGAPLTEAMCDLLVSHIH